MATRKRTAKPVKRTRAEPPRKEEVLLIPSGVTLVNCQYSDRYDGGYRPGTFINKIGDSSAGKTIESLTCFAAVACDHRFDDYNLILDEAEYGEDFDKEKLFGKRLLKRLKAPAYDAEGRPVYSNTVQDFHMHIKDHVDSGRPFIYVLDSWDAIDSEEDLKVLEKSRKSWKKGGKAEGSYGAAKAKQASAILRNVKGDIAKTKSLVIIISQTRDKMNAGAFEKKKTRSGGKALKFYCWQEQWMYLGAKITKAVHEIKYQIGVNTISITEKNRETGKLRKVTYPIYYDLGIDDVGANIAYLLEMKYIKMKKNTLVVPELRFEGSKTSLIAYVEKNNLEKKLARMVGKCWVEHEDSLKLNRKPRF